MVAALTRVFGIHNIALAVDVVQDAFCRALETWKYRGVPENPSAWLMRVARNRALDVLRRERTAMTFAPDLGRLLQTEWTVSGVVAELFDDTAIVDDQLRMMFSCCHPKLSQSTQAMLIVQLLCGFSAREIAAGFVAERPAIERRLSRAKQTLATSGPLFDIADRDEFARRLPAVLVCNLSLVQRGLPRDVGSRGSFRTLRRSDPAHTTASRTSDRRDARDARTVRAPVHACRASSGPPG